jgi:hypothetical protein
MDRLRVGQNPSDQSFCVNFCVWHSLNSSTAFFIVVVVVVVAAAAKNLCMCYLRIWQSLRGMFCSRLAGPP